MSKLTDKLKEVREEALSGLDTLAAVKGDKYAKYVQCLILTTQLSQIFHLALAVNSDSQNFERDADVIARGMSGCIAQILTNVSMLADLTDQAMMEGMDEAERMHGSIEQLVNTAVKAHKAGQPFGGVDA